MPETIISKAVATREGSGGHALVAQYAPDFTQVLPTHIRGDQWVRIAQGALKKGKKVRGPGGREMTELEVAAISNPGVFCAQLLNAARLGLEPGTEEFHLTVRKVKGNPEILGIIGYQGFIELMYRAGAVASVVAECVYTHDKFSFRPGVDARPQHEIDWDSDNRGDLRLVYSYAIMKDGATSKVVVLNRQAIAKIKESAAGANYEQSPWNTHPASMWLKSSVRQLAKWVPTSAEYRNAQQLVPGKAIGDFTSAPLPADDQPIADVTDLGEMRGDDPDLTVDAEVVDE